MVEPNTRRPSRPPLKGRSLNIMLLIITLLLSTSGKAQVVYSAQYKSDADVKVFVSEYKSDADLVVYKTKYKSDAGANDGVWFFTEYKSDAKKMIYFTEYKSDADMVIYFTEYKSDAGWKNNSKKHWMY